MSDDRERNQGMKQGTGEGTGQHAPGRNPQEDQATGRRGQHEPGMDQPGNRGKNEPGGNPPGGFDPSQGGDGGSYKEGGQNEQTRR